ncbi:MAG: serine hydroxymethyltransferase [Candidatus Magasanikbacteria bacterium]
MKRPNLKQKDPKINQLIKEEKERQNNGLEMIPSENHTTEAVLEALSSRLTDKYSEGYPGKRYYGGCEIIDKVETLAQDRAKEIFGADHANVQPLSGSPANLAVYFALMEPGDTLLGFDLSHGGHMSHGLSVNFSGTYYNAVKYGCRKEDGLIDIDQMRELAHEHEPELIVTGGSAYPQEYEWSKYKQVADEVDAYMLADMSHVAGLVAGGAHPNPVGTADVVTTTTHKTLRGPRGAVILANGKESTPLKNVEEKKENIPTLIDRAIIPGLQGGPHNHQIAAMAVVFKQALSDSFNDYADQIIKNAKTLAEEFRQRGYEIITGGTDTHLLLIDITSKDTTGKPAEKALGKAGITVNKNAIPFDDRKPYDPSGIRLGTPALTSRGMKEPEMEQIAELIDRVIENIDNEEEIEKVHQKVQKLCEEFPIKEEFGFK